MIMPCGIEEWCLAVWISRVNAGTVLEQEPTPGLGRAGRHSIVKLLTTSVPGLAGRQFGVPDSGRSKNRGLVVGVFTESIYTVLLHQGLGNLPAGKAFLTSDSKSAVASSLVAK